MAPWADHLLDLGGHRWMSRAYSEKAASSKSERACPSCRKPERRQEQPKGRPSLPRGGVRRLETPRRGSVGRSGNRDSQGEYEGCCSFLKCG